MFLFQIRSKKVFDVLVYRLCPGLPNRRNASESRRHLQVPVGLNSRHLVSPKVADHASPKDRDMADHAPVTPEAILGKVYESRLVWFRTAVSKTAYGGSNPSSHASSGTPSLRAQS